MKILFDTNVWIAAFISRGACTELYEHCLANYRLISSEWIYDEFENVLVQKFNFDPDIVEKAVRQIIESTAIISYSELNESVCHDPDDDQILAAAIAGNADCIITGDQDLLVLNSFRGISILKPAEFWRFEEGLMS